MSRIIWLLILVLNSHLAMAQTWDFTLHKHDSGNPGPTLLVIGGIQGDEPGGFNAAALLATRYQIKSGNLWVVPNLNFESIIKRSRGVHGDMNRKFKNLRNNDPEYRLVQKIKRIIKNDEIDVILNLHDGSGFYHPEYINRDRNPRRWGQSLIIDQKTVDGISFGHLGLIGEYITYQANRQISNSDYHYSVKNTRTRLGNSEMEKTLTYYAILNGKSAFGIEASKSFNTQHRAFYHLLMVENFMKFMGIGYERKFELNVSAIETEIGRNLRISLYDNRMLFDMQHVRSKLGYVPIKKDEPVDYRASNPLIAVLDNDKYLQVRYGNRSVTKLLPQYFQFDDSLEQVELQVDGKQVFASPGQIVNVRRSFRVMPLENHRVNVIGFTHPAITSEEDIEISKKQIMRQYSVDRYENIYRIEIYRENRFCGMILVNFGDHPVAVLKRETSGTDGNSAENTDS